VLEKGVGEWLKKMRSEGISFVIASNSRECRIRPFAQSAGLDYLSLCCKPLPFKMIRAAKKTGLKKSECLMVGDQIFTDVLGARLAGIKILLTEPFCEEEKASFRFRRAIEHKIKEKHERKKKQ
ncbi:MAG: YqeG family HAD IIIA-type phosphatase, partial [Acutalibacteraceae bacterium]